MIHLSRHSAHHGEKKDAYQVVTFRLNPSKSLMTPETADRMTTWVIL